MESTILRIPAINKYQKKITLDICFLIFDMTFPFACTQYISNAECNRIVHKKKSRRFSIEMRKAYRTKHQYTGFYLFVLLLTGMIQSNFSF